MTSALRALANDQKRRDEMNPLGKDSYLPHSTLIMVLAHNALEQASLSVFLECVEHAQVPRLEALRRFDVVTLLRAMRVLGNYGLARLEDGLEVEDALDKLDKWKTTTPSKG